MQTRRPIRAVVLAAGYGTRMRPLSHDLPKPLMPLWGSPVIERVLRLLRSWGVRDVLINCHHLPGALLEFARHNPVPGLRLQLSHEPDILGTGGALRRAEWFLGDDPFWLINADIAAIVRPEPFLRAFHPRRHLAALWLDPARGPRTVEMRRGLVTTFESREPGSPGTFTFCGLHLLSPRILDFLPHEGFSSIISAYASALREGERIAGVCVPGSFWADLGSPRQYLDAHRDWPGRKGGTRSVFVSAGDHARIERGAVVRNAVLWDGAVIRAGSRVEDAVVGRDTEVAGNVRYIAMRADRALDPDTLAFLQAHGWDTASTTAAPMTPRGSARAFMRLRRGSRSVVLMQYSLDREENGLYCDHAIFLARLGWRVPRVLAHDRARRLALLEDLGDTCLQDLSRRRSRLTLRRIYRQVLDAVLVLHRRGAAEARRRRLRLTPAFSPKLYRWERELFARHFLRGHLGLPAPRIRQVLQDLASVAARIEKAPPVLVHRDLQSSNIFVRKGLPFFIDFQGMRPGPAAYDLASLLCDPYVSLPPDLQDELLEYYARRAGRAAQVRELFWPAAIERLVQALGAYGRLGAIPGMESFLAHIGPACAMLQRALERAGGAVHLRRLMDDLASGRILPRGDRH